MSNTNRAFGWDLVDLAIYPDADTPPAPGSPGAHNLLTIFTSCRLHRGMETVEGRATQELWSKPLFLFENWTVEVSTVVEIGFPSLASVRDTNGPGPFWVRLHNVDLHRYGRVMFPDATLDMSDGAQSTQGVLVGYGELFWESP